MRDDGERETGRGGRGVENGRPRLPRVLVAENERDVAELIRHHLTKDGYDAVFVEPRTVDVHMARLRAKFLDAKVDLPMPPGCNEFVT